MDARGLKAADVFLQMALDFTSVAPNHPDKAVRESMREGFRKNLEYAAVCQSKHVTALPGVWFEDREKSFETCCNELLWRVEQAKKYNIIFGIEGHIGSIAQTPEELLDLLNNVPGLTLSLDYTHFLRQDIPQERCHPLIPYASHFHMRGAARGRLQTPMSENEIDYPHILKVLKEGNYDGFIGVEYTYNDWEDCNKTDNLSETILMKRLIEQ